MSDQGGNVVGHKDIFVGHKDILSDIRTFLSDIRTFLLDIRTFPLLAVFGLLWARGGRYRGTKKVLKPEDKQYKAPYNFSLA